eukprot:TRINITY_DN67284_c6_g1_i1.p1 TRINITY_DN67284_c6_g1~~TRINITY_DN67284_c6_g1_i1.p1  ORF type:complete len:908 (+),score=209.19 TRINITY_DN67284_c6_g1_i1:175-2724(+)
MSEEELVEHLFHVADEEKLKQALAGTEAESAKSLFYDRIYNQASMAFPRRPGTVDVIEDEKVQDEDEDARGEDDEDDDDEEDEDDDDDVQSTTTVEEQSVAPACPDSPMPFAQQHQQGKLRGVGGIPITPLPPSLPPGWCETRVEQHWAPAAPLPLDYPQYDPPLSDSDKADLEDHKLWLCKQIKLLWKSVPLHLQNNAMAQVAVGRVTEDMSLVVEDGLPLDWQQEEDTTPTTVEECNENEDSSLGNSVTAQFLKGVFARFQICKEYNELPVLNLFYTLFDCMLLIGKNLHVIVHKHHLVSVLECMQYNPKFNERLLEWPLHRDALSQRCQAVALPTYVADLSTTVYSLQYMKDRVIPCVCDETRYQSFNLNLARTKSKLVRAILQDRKILKQLFGVLREENGTASSKVHCLQFLREFLELYKHDFQEDPSSFWRTMLMDHALVPTLTDLLTKTESIAIKQACIDVVHYLIDEECRPMLQLQMRNNATFLFGIVSIYCHPSCTEALALQLQVILPMLMVNPALDILPLFYSACEATLKQWVSVFEMTVAGSSPSDEIESSSGSTSLTTATGTEPTSCSSTSGVSSSCDEEEEDVPQDEDVQQTNPYPPTALFSMTDGIGLPSVTNSIDCAVKRIGTVLPTTRLHANNKRDTTVVNAFLEMLSLCVHHHYRSFSFKSDTCVLTLINAIAALWNGAAPTVDSLIASNKGLLSILHLHHPLFYQAIVSKNIFQKLLGQFTDGNNLINSSILTLLHTILQLDLQPLVSHIAKLFQEKDGPPESPTTTGTVPSPGSFVKNLFYASARSKELDNEEELLAAAEEDDCVNEQNGDEAEDDDPGSPCPGSPGPGTP